MKRIKKQFDWDDVESQKLFMSATDEFVIEERFVNEAESLVNTFNITSEDKVLDFACGIGKHAIEIARSGYNIAGYDKSNFYLDKACKIAEKNKIEIKFYDDLEDLKSTNKQYNFIYTINFPISYFEEEEFIDILEVILDLLKAEGEFLLGFPYTRENREEKLPSNSWQEENRVFYLSDKRIDDTGEKTERYLKIDPEAEKITEWIDKCKHYYLREIKNILKNANFKPIACYENLNGDITKKASQVHYILCKKNNKD